MLPRLGIGNLAQGLSVPGELGSLTLRSPVTMYVCGTNAGAASVADELKERAGRLLHVADANGLQSPAKGKVALLLYLSNSTWSGDNDDGWRSRDVFVEQPILLELEVTPK